MSIFASRRERGGSLIELPLSLISTNPDQPRRFFDEASLAELAASIAEVGLIQPIVVRRTKDGYVLVAGERRLRAMRMNGAERIRCIVLADEECPDPAIAAVVENVQREDLHFFEEAECYAAILGSAGITREQLAEKLGKSLSFVANKLRLTSFPPELRARIIKAGLSERHARALLRLDSEELCAEALSVIVKKGLSVQQTEKLVDKLISDAERSGRRRPRLLRLFRDYRIFVNTVNAACDQLRESGLCVLIEQNETEQGVDIRITVSQKSE